MPATPTQMTQAAMDTRTWAAVLSGFGILIASIVVEQVCGVYSENCVIDWSGFYGSRATYVQINACIDPPSPDTGLGIPMLSVSSLFLLEACKVS